ncbi:hypothetical protein Lalb_Chr21g0316481 [Lupinus albus]|uniref:Uncharacterized protein n=1 Tax=Lupinus albus TaxID=3870 RepID=A0A6A4NU53_LUPAL|nr:hypothetical protein Lalb_Chr21g0316481 [Lupinus albus]
MLGEIRHEEFYTEETGTLNYEFGNLIRWRKTFGNVVLIMYCSGLEWRLLYGRRTIWTLLYKKEIWIKHTSKYLPKIFDQFSSAEGFLFLQDNTILNYWNLVPADKTKLWIMNKVFLLVFPLTQSMTHFYTFMIDIPLP